MSIDILIYGRLRGAVTVKTVANGNAYALSKPATADKKSENVLVSCIAFSAPAIKSVARMSAVSGDAAISASQGNDCATHHELDVTVYAAMSAYHVGCKRVDKPQSSQQHVPDKFGDTSDLNCF